MHSIKSLALGAVLWLGGTQGAPAALFDVSLDTAAYAGASVLLVFDWTANDGAADNAVEVSGFATDGAFDPFAATSLGDVSGALDASVLLGDAQPFNEFSQPMTLGGALGFRLAVGGLFSGTGAPDALSLFLLDAGSGLPLFPTQDLAGNDALLTIEASGGGGPGVYIYPPASGAGSAVQVARIDAVPEPSVLWLWLAGALLARRFAVAAGPPDSKPAPP